MDIFEIKNILRTRIDIAVSKKNSTEECLLRELVKVCDEVQYYRNSKNINEVQEWN